MYHIQEELCTYCNFCGEKGPQNCYPARTAKHGLEGNFPSRDESHLTVFGKTQSAGEQFWKGTPRYKFLRDVILVPELLDTERVIKKEEIRQEPLYIHVDLSGEIGGFKTSTPLVIAAMGSTDVANLIGQDLGFGAAKAGIVYAIGENILNMWGYEKRVNESMPCLRDRIFSFLRDSDGQGGVVIQQNIEDRAAHVWKTIYNDEEMAEYFKAGLIGFEVKLGQGAKPGMGGEVKVSREKARRLYDLYHFPINPYEVEQALYQRHAVPGTFTAESLRQLINQIFEEYPAVQTWVKTGPYGDLMTQIEILEEMAKKHGKTINLTIDGTEGGTGMSPSGPMNDIGLPTLLCLSAIQKAKKQGYNHLHYTLAGGLFNGRHLVKAIALGADNVAYGQGMAIAAMAGRFQFVRDDFAGESQLVKAGAEGIRNYVLEGVLSEAKMMISSLGKYSLSSLKPNQGYKIDGQEIVTVDAVALDREVAEILGLLYAYDPNLWNKMTILNEERRKRLFEN